MELLTAFLATLAAWLLFSRKKPAKPEFTKHDATIIRLDGWPEGKPKKKPKPDLKVWSITEPSMLPYTAAVGLLTDSELRFFRVLEESVGHKLRICPKVRLADIIRCTDDEWKAGYGPPISQKHIDFVLTYPDSLKVVCALELDDSSHKAKGRQIRDEFVTAALLAARIPFVRRKVEKEYDAGAISRHVWREIRLANK